MWGDHSVSQPRTPDGRYASKVTLGSILAAAVVAIAAAVGVGAEGAAVKQKSGNTQRRLVASGLRSALRAEADSGSCAADARGEVREFLATHPCESVYRALLEVRRGDVAAVVAVAWIEMVQESDATELKALVDRPGTGNVNQLPPPRGQEVVEVVEPAYASRQRGRLVVTVEAQPVAVTASQRVLEQIAEEAADTASRPE